MRNTQKTWHASTRPAPFRINAPPGIRPRRRPGPVCTTGAAAWTDARGAGAFVQWGEEWKVRFPLRDV
ncbi:hypothetical protein GCM10010346_34770 [Streptomyces chryseus]|uniref:Uncharacterized protein n=1 Tax=Streptomyces chryseus TaxID=68186 RepID=A0ABQ3DT76_9ACTN|nr:hypothetical protein GCM10010346_34770 [Streptomyces chryseus]